MRWLKAIKAGVHRSYYTILPTFIYVYNFLKWKSDPLWSSLWWREHSAVKSSELARLMALTSEASTLENMMGEDPRAAFPFPAASLQQVRAHFLWLYPTQAFDRRRASTTLEKTALPRSHQETVVETQSVFRGEIPHSPSSPDHLGAELKIRSFSSPILNLAPHCPRIRKTTRIIAKQRLQ